MNNTADLRLIAHSLLNVSRVHELSQLTESYCNSGLVKSEELPQARIPRVRSKVEVTCSVEVI